MKLKLKIPGTTYKTFHRTGLMRSHLHATEPKVLRFALLPLSHQEDNCTSNKTNLA